MLNEEMSAGTKAEQSTNDETRVTSANAIGNTNVVGRLMSFALFPDKLEKFKIAMDILESIGVEIHSFKSNGVYICFEVDDNFKHRDFSRIKSAYDAGGTNNLTISSPSEKVSSSNV